MQYLNANQADREKAFTQECCERYWTSPGGNTPKKQLSGHLPSTMKTIQISRTRHTWRSWRSKEKLITDVLPWNPCIDAQKLVDQLEPIYNNSLPKQDVAWKTCHERWTIGTSEQRASAKSVQAVQHDYDYIYIYICVCVCVCARARAHACIYIYIYIYIYMGLCVLFSTVEVCYVRKEWLLCVNILLKKKTEEKYMDCIYRTPPYEKEMTQGQIFSVIQQVWIQNSSASKTVAHTEA